MSRIKRAQSGDPDPRQAEQIENQGEPPRIEWIGPGRDAMRRYRAVAVEFVEAFNDRDAERMAALVRPDFAFRPTALTGVLGELYEGHDGLRACVAELTEREPGHLVTLDHIRSLSETHHLVVVQITDAGLRQITCTAVVEFDGELIHSISTHLLDPDVVVALGLTESP